MGRFHTESLTSVFSGKTGRAGNRGALCLHGQPHLVSLKPSVAEVPTSPYCLCDLKAAVITHDLFLKNK